MRRRLLNIASVVCLVACVALIGLWVRSYSWMDDFNFNPLGASSVGGGSAVGRIAIGTMSANITGANQSLFKWNHSPVRDWRSDLARIDQRFSSVAGFGVVHDVDQFVLMVPYWFAVLLVGALSFAPWSRVKYRFSLRTMLIATTLVALLLGMIAWLDRA